MEILGCSAVEILRVGSCFSLDETGVLWATKAGGTVIKRVLGGAGEEGGKESPVIVLNST